MAIIARVFSAVAVSGTTAYKSRVSYPDTQSRHFYQVKLTSTATGTLKGQVNCLIEGEYEAAVAAAAGATRELKEAANDTGWIDQSFLQSDVINAGATFTMNGATSAADALINMPSGPARHRLVYTNATNSGTITAFRVTE